MTGAELRRIRTQLGLTQTKLAALVGVVANTIARQERGEMGIKEPLARLLRLLTKHHDRRAPRRKAR
jgi:transcriptional regulator with XRE-family HTH domain